MIEDLPPGLEKLYQRVQHSLSDLNSRTGRFRWYEFGDPDEIGPIDEELVRQIAADPRSTIEIKQLSDGLSRGVISWAAVADGRYPLPPELRELVSMGVAFARPVVRPEPPVAAEPYAIPSLYDDYSDENQMPESWLE